MASDQVMGQGPFDMKYFLSGASGGGICCSITHGGLVPVDVVKTKIQLQPDVYNKGFIGGFGQVIEAEGMNGLLTGLGPTAQGYFIQGWFKFAHVEFFKINITKSVGEQKPGTGAAGLYLLGLERHGRVHRGHFPLPLRGVPHPAGLHPAYADSMVGCASKMMAEQGFGAFYSGFVPILCKQIPYTMAKFAEARPPRRTAGERRRTSRRRDRQPGRVGRLVESTAAGAAAGLTSLVVEDGDHDRHASGASGVH